MISWRRNWPIIDAKGFLSKNDYGGNYLLNFDTGDVKFIVTNIGNVTNRS